MIYEGNVTFLKPKLAFLRAQGQKCLFLRVVSLIKLKIVCGDRLIGKYKSRDLQVDFEIKISPSCVNVK